MSAKAKIDIDTYLNFTIVKYAYFDFNFDRGSKSKQLKKYSLYLYYV